MRFIPTRIHGMLDYLMGIVLILAPFILGFADEGAEMWVPIILGAGLLAYSLFTAYELGLVPAIPMPIHLGLDVASGVVLAVSPWLFGFSEDVWVPHVAVGILEIGAGIFTSTVPSQRSMARPR